MKSRHLEIYNFGPIREAKMDFTRVNVFIGPQSAGKSCILKIACHCAWVEKCLMHMGDVSAFQEDNYFFKQLISFHNLQGYVTDSAMRILYKTPFLTLEYIHSKKQFVCDFNRDGGSYKCAKLSYIPAERNVISTVPNWMKLAYEDTNTRSFMADWIEARKEFTAAHTLPILSLGAEYFYDSAGDVDLVRIDGMKNALRMLNVSSGLQSLIPLMLYVHYLSHSVFDDRSASVLKDEKNKALMHRMYRELPREEQDGGLHGDGPYVLNLNNEFLHFASERMKDDFLRLYNNYTYYQHSDIFLEEPEENLFPETQSEVVRYLLGEVFSSGRENTLFMATHSPYILYALNNAILANIVRGNIPAEDFPEKYSATFNTGDISVWQVRAGAIESVKSGESNTIQDKDGLIRKNYFDSVMKNVMDDFTNMLGYRDYE